MKRRERNKHNPWKSMADLFSALALIFMLLLMLMLATWLNDKEYDGEQYEYSETAYHEYDDHDEDEDDNGGGGGGETVSEPEEVIEGTDKIAVRVIVVDAETNRVVEKPGIKFNLFIEGGVQKTLYSYYPEKTGYQTFETRADGSFFLPEKIGADNYRLKSLNAPTGYVSGSSQSFTIDGVHDWNNPYLAYFALDPIKTDFTIRAVDSETGEPVAGGSFEVFATEDLVYSDGTVFAHKGDTVDTLVPNEDGYATSKILHFNSLLAIRHISAPGYYAVHSAEIPVPPGTSAETDGSTVIEIPIRMSAVQVSVTDELNKTGLNGVGLSLTNASDNTVQSLSTDEKGAVSVRKLNKNTDYVLEQTEWLDKYRPAPKAFAFRVDELGHINGKEVESHAIRNRMIRVGLHCRSWYTYKDLDGYTMSVVDAAGNSVSAVSESGELVEGLEPGTYQIKVTGKWNFLISGGSIEVEDVAQVQSFNVHIMTVWGLIIWILLIASVIALSILAVLWYKKKKKRRKEQAALKESEMDG